MYGEFLEVQCQHTQWKDEIPDRKKIAVNLPLNLFPATITNTDIGSQFLKSLHTLFVKHFVYMLVKFLTKSDGPHHTKANFCKVTKC